MAAMEGSSWLLLHFTIPRESCTLAGLRTWQFHLAYLVRLPSLDLNAALSQRALFIEMVGIRSMSTLILTIEKRAHATSRIQLPKPPSRQPVEASIDHKAEKIADPHTRHTHESRITPKIFSECYTASICEFRLSKLLVIREGKRQTLLRASRFVLGSYHS